MGTTGMRTKQNFLIAHNPTHTLRVGGGGGVKKFLNLDRTENLKAALLW